MMYAPAPIMFFLRLLMKMPSVRRYADMDLTRQGSRHVLVRYIKMQLLVLLRWSGRPIFLVVYFTLGLGKPGCRGCSMSV